MFSHCGLAGTACDEHGMHGLTAFYWWQKSLVPRDKNQ